MRQAVEREPRPRRVVEADEASGEPTVTVDVPALRSEPVEEASGDTAAEAALLPGELVTERFRVARLLGRGGVGHVYSARDLLLGQDVAIKVVRPRFAPDVALEMLRREVVLARRIVHPGICQVYDLFRLSLGDRELVFLTMELLHGETLRERLQREGPLAEDEALRVAQRLAGVVDALHAAGVVHGDLKTSNVLLSSGAGGQRVILADFGLAGATAEAGLAAPAGWGTPGYVAPEIRATGRPLPASDVYAYGALLHALIAGDAPRRDGLAASLSPAWRTAIVACLNLQPERRPRAAGLVVEEIALSLRLPQIAEGIREPPRRAEAARRAGDFAAAPEAAGERDEPAGSDLRKAVSHLRRHEPVAARELLLRSIRDVRSRAPAYAALARAALALRRPREAELYARRGQELTGGEDRRLEIELQALQLQAEGRWSQAAQLHRALRAFFPDAAGHAEDLVDALIRCGHSDEPLAILRELSLTAKAEHEGATRALLRAQAEAAGGEIARAVETNRRAAKEARKAGCPGILADARLHRGELLLRLGKWRAASRTVRSAARLFETQGRSADAAECLRQLVIGQRHLAPPEDLCGDAEKALRLSAEAGDRRGLADSLNQTGVLHLVRDDLEAAEKRLRESVELSRSIGNAAGLSRGLANLAILECDRGRLRAALELIEQALRTIEPVDDAWSAARIRLSQANCLHILGRSEAAESLFHELARQFEQTGAPPDARAAECLWALTRIERGELGGVRAVLAAAKRSGRARGDLYLLGLADAVRGRLALYTDHLGAGRRSVARARYQYWVTATSIVLEAAAGELEAARRKARELFAASRRRRRPASALFALGMIVHLSRRPSSPQTLRMARAAVRQAREVEDRLTALDALARAGLALVRGGCRDEGFAALADARREAAERRLLPLCLQTDLMHGQAEIVAGRPSAGRSRLEEVATVAHSRGLRLLERLARESLAGAVRLSRSG